MLGPVTKRKKLMVAAEIIALWVGAWFGGMVVIGGVAAIIYFVLIGFGRVPLW